MRVTAMYDLRGKMADAVAWATQHEDLGFDAVHFPEVARNPFTSLTLAAEHTEYSTRIWPPWRRTMSEEIASPRPVPWSVGLVV